MSKTLRRILLTHLLLLLLVLEILLCPKTRETTRGYGSLLAGIAIMELLFLFFLYRRKRKQRPDTGVFDIMTLVLILMILWEWTTSVKNVAHPVLLPSPENVFDTFRLQWPQLLTNIFYSLRLLLTGFLLGLAAAVLCGLIAGWVPRIRDFACPIANVLAPIPPIVISPYLVALMPTFRAASLAVIILGVFWPAFLNTVNRIQSMEPRILDSARMLQPGTATMITHILLPYLLPGIIQGLKVSLTSSLLMLNFAELMGATHGMGFYVQNSIAYANYTHAVAGILVIGIVVTILNQLVSVVQKKAIRWH